jgi:hypothetical protein
MKKALIPILSVLLLTLAFTSCDASIRQDIAGLMGDFSGNVYIESGMVEPDLGAAEDANNETTQIGTSSGSTGTATVVIRGSTSTITTSAFGGIDISVDVDDDELNDGTLDIIAPQPADKQQAYTNDLAESITSPSKKEKLLTDMAKPATAEQKEMAKGSVIVFNAVVDKIAADIDDSDIDDSDIKAAIEELKLDSITDEDELTQGDMAILQLMTNLVSNTVAAAKDSYGAISDAEITDEEALDIFSEALFTAKVTEELSGISSINFSGELISGLLGALDDGDDGSQSVSRTTDVGLEDIEDSIGVDTLNSLVPKIVKVMGITGSGENLEYELKDYRSFLRKQKVYLASLNQAIAFYREGSLSANEAEQIDAGTLVKYILAFMTTMIDDYYQNYGTYNDSNTPTYGTMPAAYVAFLNANPKLTAGTLSGDDTLNVSVMDDLMGGMDTYIDEVMQDKLEKLVVRTKVLVEISGFENEELNDLLDELPTTIKEWFADYSEDV